MGGLWPFTPHYVRNDSPMALNQMGLSERVVSKMMVLLLVSFYRAFAISPLGIFNSGSVHGNRQDKLQLLEQTSSDCSKPTHPKTLKN